jgi:signal transduction protein with GAF and PtsI domain
MLFARQNSTLAATDARNPSRRRPPESSAHSGRPLRGAARVSGNVIVKSVTIRQYREQCETNRKLLANVVSRCLATEERKRDAEERHRLLEDFAYPGRSARGAARDATLIIARC